MLVDNAPKLKSSNLVYLADTNTFKGINYNQCIIVASVKLTDHAQGMRK